MKTPIVCSALLTIVLTPAAAQAVLEEVRVTAQRREQSLQEVPVAVTAFTGDLIEQANIRGATDYLSLTPNVSFTEDGQSGSRGLGIAVRGVNNLVSGENAFVASVGIYLDGFSIASVPNQVANPFLPDMERIEVLRGPQGTYFGRNAVGGALNLTTRAPTDEFGFKVTLGGEAYEDANEQFNATGVVNVPVTDTFKLRGVLYYEDSGGLVDNICPAGASMSECPVAFANNFTPNGAEDSSHDYVNARLRGVWDATEDTTFDFTLIYADQDQEADETVPSGILDVDTVDSFGIQEAIDPGTGFWPQNRDMFSHDLPEENTLETFIGVFNVTHRISDDLVLHSVTGVIDAEQGRLFDNDLVGGVDVIFRDNLYEGTSWSTELRLEGTGDTLDWVIGAIYSEDEQTQDNKVGVSTRPTDTINGVGFLPPFPTGLGLALNNKLFEVKGAAIFGDLTFHFNEQTDFIFGGRFSYDEVTQERMDFGIGPTCGVPGLPACTIGFFQEFANMARPMSMGEETFTDFAPRFGVRIQVTDETGIYGMVSKGYKAGGNSVGNNTNAPGQPAFAVFYDKETLWNYELGVKSELFDRRLRVNAAAFHLEWNDLQFESFRFLTPGDLSSNFEQTINIENAEASGFELEFTAVPLDGLTLTGGVGYLDTEITSDTMAEITGGFQVDLKGLDIPKSPEWTASLAGEYRWPIGANEAWVRVEYIHRDGQYSDIEGLTNRQTRGPSPNQGLMRPVGPGEFPYLSPDYDLVNLRAGFDMGPWSFVFYVQNVTDEEYYTGTQENFGISGIRLRPHPRFYGGSVSYSFGGI